MASNENETTKDTTTNTGSNHGKLSRELDRCPMKRDVGYCPLCDREENEEE